MLQWIDFRKRFLKTTKMQKRLANVKKMAEEKRAAEMRKKVLACHHNGHDGEGSHVFYPQDDAKKPVFGEEEVLEPVAAPPSPARTASLEPAQDESLPPPITPVRTVSHF